MDAVSGVICAAVDPALGYTEACSSSGGLLAVAPAEAALGEGSSPTGVTVDTSSGLRTLVLSGAGEGEKDAAVLDLTVDVSRVLSLRPNVLHGVFIVCVYRVC